MTKKRGLTGIFMLLVFAILTACGEGGTADSPAAISSQPTDQNVVVGTTATFTVVATNATGYQWQLSTDAGTTFTDVSGATAASHTTPVTTLADSGTRYRVVVSGMSNSVNSSAVTLTVTSAADAPAITVQPAHASVTAPATANFSVTATGTNLNYQWQQCQDSNEICAGWSDLSGAIAATYSTGPTDVSMTGQRFRVIVSNTEGSLDSAVVSLNVDPTPVAPVITSQPVDAAVVAPATASFTVAFTSVPTVLPNWQYSNNGSDWFNLGVFDNTYTTAPTSIDDNGRQFRAILENAAGSVTTNVVTLTVTTAASAPSFATQPVDVSITEGQNAQFTVVVSGTPAPTLQWQLSTDSGGSWSNINGATGTVLDVLNAALANNGRQFRVVASNSAGVVNSNAATLTVNPPSPLLNIVFSRGYGIESGKDDLYLIKEDGTGEVPLATTVDQESFAAVAPGGRIVYHRVTSSAMDLYSVNSGGTDVQTLADTSDYERFSGITTSGRVIYRRDTAAGGRDLWSVNADGSNPQVLANSANHEDFSHITASGRVIYSVTQYIGNDLYVVDADGTGNAALATEPYYYKSVRGETPSGQIIFDIDNGYGNGLSGIYSINGAGGSATPLAVNSVAYEYESAGITRTGQVIINRSVDGQRDLYGNGTVPLATSTDYETYAGSTAAGRVIYRRLTAGQNDLYIVDADGSNTQQLTDASGDDYFAATTPDGRVIYVRITGGLYDIYMVNADGTGTVAVASSADFEDYKGMTSDGHVIYERTTNNVYYLYAYNTANNTTTPLVTSGGHAFFVGVTPNDKLLFRRQSGNADLYIINADGTGLTPLANTGNNEFFGAVFQ